MKETEREREREREWKTNLQVLFTEYFHNTITMEATTYIYIYIYIYIQSKRESTREIGNCLTRALTDLHTYTTRNNKLIV